MPPRHRRLFQLGFFALFLSAPALDLLRFDLHEAQLWFLGQRWSLGIDAFRAGRIGPTEVALSILLKGFLPALLLVGAFLAVAWRHGRLYCGWLCPHFSLVELLNDTLLTYLLPPAEVWGGLWRGTLSPNQARFLVIATVVFTLEFALARHLFCRFGCAVGLFQSLVWMANPRGMVVAFRREQARDCRDCGTARYGQGSACDHGCPMRLHPRQIKRMMFSCVQCGQCLQACDESQRGRDRPPLLEWKIGLEAVRETLRQRRDAGEGD